MNVSHPSREAACDSGQAGSMEDHLKTRYGFWHLVLAAMAFALVLLLANGGDFTRQGIDRVVRLVAREQLQDWAQQIVRRHPEVIRSVGRRPLPDEVVADLRREAEMYGIEAFRLHSRAEPLGHVRMYARNTFNSPYGKLATMVIVAGAQGAVSDTDPGLVRVQVPLQDEQGKVLGRLTAVVNKNTLRRELAEALRHISYAALAAIIIVLLLSLFLYRQLRSNAAAHIHYMRDYDEVTGLPNQNAFEQHLDKLLFAENDDNDGRDGLACMVFGVDNLGQVTCAEGHEATGHVLRTLAGRFARVVHETGGHIFCLERDEFAVLLPVPRPDQKQVLRLGQALMKETQRPVYWRGKSLLLSISIGVTFHPTPAQERSEILRQATLMREAAHEAGGNALRIYDAEMDKEFNEIAHLERLLRKAARNCAHYFTLHFQPIVRLQDETLHGFEVLLRMDDDDGTPISPAVFIPIAERLNLMDEIGAYVLSEACNIASRWPDNLKVSVNLSPAQFESGRLPSTVRKALETSGLKPERLELEVTESIMMQDWSKVRDQLRAVRKRGASVVLDDFGTGYSSMSYLWKFDFDKIKIDRSFTQAVSTSHEARSILRALVVMARSLKLPVVVEGVETREQAVILRKFRCDYGQGWLFGKPMPAEELSATILRHWRQQNDNVTDLHDAARASAAL